MSQSSRPHLIERAAGIMGREQGLPLLPATTSRADQFPPPPAAPAEQQALTAAAPPPAIAVKTLLAAGLLPLAGGRRQRVLEELALIHHQVLRGVDEASLEPPARRRIVLVASALRHEGKSFVALNMAAGIASAGGRPVLLIDADGRLGGMTSLLEVTDRPGLLDLVARPATQPDQVVVPTGVRRLSFVPHGLANGIDAPAGSTVAQAILRLATMLPDHVLILDPPPCLSTSDCSTLAAVAGQVVLVVDAERTRADEVEAALDVLDACPVTRLMLNRMRLSTPDTFGAHGEYGAPHVA